MLGKGTHTVKRKNGAKPSRFGLFPTSWSPDNPPPPRCLPGLVRCLVLKADAPTCSVSFGQKTGGQKTGIPITGHTNFTNNASMAIRSKLAGIPALKNSEDLNWPLP